MNTNASMREIVSMLQSQGHDIEFYARKDGGILIRKIDGVSYPSGASGNARARSMAGASISEARVKQLKYATRTRAGYRKKKISLDDQIEKEYNRVKRKWNKAFKSKDGQPHPAGYFGKARIRYAMEHYGKEEALRRIMEAEKYASGIAYAKNVEILAQFIRSAGESVNSQDLISLAQDIIDNAYSIREEWIAPAYDALYTLNQGVSPQEVARTTRAILRL